MLDDTTYQNAEIIDSRPLKTTKELISEYEDLAGQLADKAEQIAESTGDPYSNPFTAIDWHIFRIESDLRSVQEALQSIKPKNT